jgi:hypothetical protein
MPTSPKHSPSFSYFNQNFKCISHLGVGGRGWAGEEFDVWTDGKTERPGKADIRIDRQRVSRSEFRYVSAVDGTRVILVR